MVDLEAILVDDMNAFDKNNGRDDDRDDPEPPTEALKDEILALKRENAKLRSTRHLEVRRKKQMPSSRDIAEIIRRATTGAKAEKSGRSRQGLEQNERSSFSILGASERLLRPAGSVRIAEPVAKEVNAASSEVSCVTLGGVSLKAFLNAVRSAVSVSETQGGLERHAFSNFSLLSVNDESIEQKIGDDFFLQGSHYLDPFRFQETDVLDVYPDPKTDNGKAPMFDFKDLSAFCFPYGVRARLIPRVALERAEQFGWLGETADRYQALLFTDGSGVTSTGVAITCRAVVHSPNLFSQLSVARKRRRSALIICRWWKMRKKEKLRAGYTNNTSENQQFGDSCDCSGSFLEGKSDLSLLVRDVSGWLRGDSSVCDSSTASGFKGMTSSFSSLTDFQAGLLGRRSSLVTPPFTRSASCSSKPKPVVRRSASRNVQVADTLEAFLLSSPIPRFESRKGTGVWISAKLKSSRSSGQYAVVLKVVAREYRQENELYDVEEKLEEERLRLSALLKDICVSPSTPEKRIDKVIFQECSIVPKNVPGNPSKDDSSMVSNSASFGTDSKAGCSTTSRSLKELAAIEAYQTMAEAEKMGDVCVVDRCYILMGGQPGEQSLLLAALQPLVTSERKQNTALALDEQLTPDLNHCEQVQTACQKEEDEVASEDISYGGDGVDKTKRKTIVQNRYKILDYIQQNAVLAPHQLKVCYPSSELEHILQKREYFNLTLPIEEATPLNIPIPLPQMTTQWAVGMLLLRTGCLPLMKVINALLRERSLLILGRSPGEVSSCALALLDLLKPYEWPSTFLPLLPSSLLDFILSPVPFVVGMSVESEEEVLSIQTDDRMVDALSNGMSLLNLTTGSLLISKDFEDEDDTLSLLSPGLVGTLQSLQTRLEKLAEKPDSTLRHLKHYDPVSTFKSIKSFVQTGLTPHESLTLQTVKKRISKYTKSLAGELHFDKSSWRRYGTDDTENGFLYDPNLYLEPMRARLKFMEEMAQTQMFCFSVNSYRNAELAEEQRRKSAGRRITDWIRKRRLEKDHLRESAGRRIALWISELRREKNERRKNAGRLITNWIRERTLDKNCVRNKLGKCSYRNESLSCEGCYH